MNKNISKGFDRDLDFNDIKGKLITMLSHMANDMRKGLNTFVNKKYNRQRRYNKLCYLVIALIQLRNGSRISEACKAFLSFVAPKNNKLDKVIVKISKSESLKYNKLQNKKVMTKARYRKMMFPSQWIDKSIWNIIINSKYLQLICECNRLKKRVLDFLLKNFNCNTHSLRYAFINHLLYVEKRPMNDVAKFVGHTTVNQLVTYTQHKNCEQIFNLNL